MFSTEYIGLIVIIVIIALFVFDLGVDGGGGIFAVFGIIIGLIMASNTLKELEFKEWHTQEIHSTAGNYNNITGSFYLGTGYISSREMYTGNTFDGEAYERIYIPVAGVRRIIDETLTDKAIYKIPFCTYKPNWLWHSDTVKGCHQKGELRIPKGSIIKQMKFQ